MAWTAPEQWPETPEWKDCNFHDDLGVRVDRPPEDREKIAAVVLGAAVAATELKKPIARRSLLFPWRRR